MATPTGAPAPPPPVPGLVEATRRELIAAGRDSSMLGEQALVLARRLEACRDTGSAIAALSREFRSTMEAALQGAKQPDSVAAGLQDEVASRRERRTARSA